jgi:hypothetical protein
MTSGTGTCSVKYDQAGSTNYNPAPQVTETVNAQKAAQAINVTTHAPASATYNTSFGVAATALGGAVTFSNAGACTNVGSTFTMTSGTGTCSVRYDQAGDANYNPAPQVTETVNAQKADQTVTVTTHAPASAAYNTNFTVAATAPGGTVSFSSGGSCSNTGATFTITSGSGTCSVMYDQAGNANYNAAPQVTESVNAQKADQTITVSLFAPSSAVYNTSFSVAASGGGSGNAVTFTNGGACTNSGDTFTMTSGTGTCSVKFDQAGDANYNAAPQVVESVTAQKAGQTINITTHAPASAASNQQFTVAATGGGSGNAVAFSSSGACSNSGATFTITSATGTCSVRYDQAGDSNYNAAPQVVETVSVGKTDQTITVTTHAPASAVYNTQFTVAATGGGSGNPVTFSSAGACSNSGDTFTMTSGTGTCSVKFDQAGDANYNAAPQVVETVNAQKANQTITVTLFAPGSAVYNTSFSVAASGGGSGNAVTFSSGGVCTNSGGTFTMTSGTGTCSVKFDQTGDTNYNAAPQVVESVTAQKASHSITFAPLPDKTFGDPDFMVSATSDSGLAVSFGASGNCTVTGATVHLTGPGSCTITASQAGNGNYSAAADVPRTFTINSPAAGVSQLTANSACSAFPGGTAQTLGMVEYTAKSGTINKTIPAGFYYWVKVTAPAGPNSFTVAQSITTGNFSTQFALAGGTNVFNSACAKKLHPTITAGAGGVTATFTAPSAGTYYIGIQYTTSSVKGKPVPSPTTVHYEFSTGGVSASTSGLDLKQQVPASAASSVRAAMFRALKR